MSDQANIVGKVTADTSSAVRSVNELKKAVDQSGGAWANFSAKGSKALSDIGDAFAKFNLALGGVQKALQLAEGVAEMVKFAAEAKNAENRMRALGVSAYEMAGAVGGSVDDVSLLKFGLRQLQGESALTKDQMLLVLKAADNLGDKLGGDTMKIAEDLATALKGGPVKALREYNIAIDESVKGTNQVNGLMAKFKEIANETVVVDAQLEAIDRVGAGWKNMVADVKVFIAEVLTSIYDMFDELTDRIADVDRDQDLAASREHFRQVRLNKLRNEEIATLATSVTDKFKAKPDTKKSARKGSFSRPEFASLGIADAATQMNTMFAEALGDEYASDPNADLLARLKASTDELQASFNGLAQSLPGVDAEYQRAIDQQQAYIDNNIAMAASQQVVNDAMATSTQAFGAFFQALADGQNPFAAFIKTGAMLLKAEAIKNAALALSATAAGLFGINPGGNFKAAAAFAKAAAANAAGAVVLGAMAGSSGGASPSSPTAGGFSGPTITGQKDSGGITIVVDGNLYGDPQAFGRAVVDGMERAAQTGRTRLRPNRWH